MSERKVDDKFEVTDRTRVYTGLWYAFFGALVSNTHSYLTSVFLYSLLLHIALVMTSPSSASELRIVGETLKAMRPHGLWL